MDISGRRHGEIFSRIKKEKLDRESGNVLSTDS